MNSNSSIFVTYFDAAVLCISRSYAIAERDSLRIEGTKVAFINCSSRYCQSEQADVARMGSIANHMLLPVRE